jgi:hypothetical protein
MLQLKRDGRLPGLRKVPMRCRTYKASFASCLRTICLQGYPSLPRRNMCVLLKSIYVISAVGLFLSGCSTPNLVGVARRRPAKPADSSAVGSASNNVGGTKPHSDGSGTPPAIPAQLLPRNARLENAFETLSEDQASKLLQDKGKFPQGGVTSKEYLAKLVLADADLPLLENRTAIYSLAFYRGHATDEATTAKLENAYRQYSILPPISP